MLSGGGACTAGARPPPQRQRRRSCWGGRHASCGWSEGGSQLLTWSFHAAPRRAATSPLPATDPEHSEPGGAGVRGMWALSGGSPRGARGAGAGPRGAGGPGFELLLGLPTTWRVMKLNAANKESEKQHEKNRLAAIVHFLVAPLRIAPQLRAQGHVEARRQKVVRLRGHAAKDRLAVRRDAAARRQWLAAGGAGAAKVLDRCLSSSCATLLFSAKCSGRLRGCPSALFLFSTKCCGRLLNL